MDPGLRLSRLQCPQTTEESSQMHSINYLGAVGALRYLATSTRPDIAYAVSVLTHFNAILVWPIGMQSSIYFIISRALVVARILDTLLVLMWSTWVLVSFLEAPSFRDLLPKQPLRQSILLQWKLARKLFGCAICLRRWALLSVPFPSCTLTTSLSFR